MKPFDIHLIFGSDNTGKQIAKVDIEFELKAENIPKICKVAELKESVGEDLIIKFDFTTQEGREKQCIEYFESGLDYDDKDSYDYDLSPLQNWFARPKKSGRLELYESTEGEGKGRVTLEYRIYKEQIEEQGEDIPKLLSKFSESTFHPDLKLTANFYGEVQTSKKNRIKLKLDYIDFHATSEEFRMKDLLNLLQLTEVFGVEEEAEEILKNPLFKFVQNAEEIQIKMKLASIRKILRLYQIGITEKNTQKETHIQHPDVIKSLFKDEIRVTFIYSNCLAFIAKYSYRNQAVMIRMLTGMKKYMKYFD